MRDMLSQSQSAAAAEEEKAGIFRRAREGLRAWMEAWAASAAEAALYGELSRLSDAELERRGIPRGDLHRFIRHPE
jgi:hypothetical protein